jgi:hypothetical protein
LVAPGISEAGDFYQSVWWNPSAKFTSD